MPGDDEHHGRHGAKGHDEPDHEGHGHGPGGHKGGDGHEGHRHGDGKHGRPGEGPRHGHEGPPHKGGRHPDDSCDEEDDDDEGPGNDEKRHAGREAARAWRKEHNLHFKDMTKAQKDQMNEARREAKRAFKAHS